MICPSCGYGNLQGEDECSRCMASLQQEDVPQPDTPQRWRIMVDPISSLEASKIEVQIVAAGTSLADGIRRMQEKNVGYLLVTKPDGSLAGIFTEHDVAHKIAGIIDDLAGHTVDEYMVRNPTSLKKSEPIKHAIHHMAVNRFMYIPLVDDEGRPEDLVSFRRIARLIEQME
jgi:CBS domain-containing protein